ncbi:hypothetical protein [Streptomyces antarcticus]|uniref:hypothetical protein n=1 Tax=Streptomyces antarcticus TaxID=2996458 RepID=UPI002270B920|nr:MULTISPECIES: hypothetical protein [unclassified Streptomyces]MCY0941935.1 hypothetical protein [Streptomyces sp. H34-AA3]MCZ4082793.1 hypothetical protein [Streptomyces sp. H34-S5]
MPATPLNSLSELGEAIDGGAFHRLTPEPVALPRYDTSTEVVKRVLVRLHAVL